MDALSAIKVPDDPGPFKRAEDRWKPYLDDPETAVVFAGPVLTHSDWTPDNVLVSEQRAWLIDWAWPTLGAAWTDPACWVLRLMASGGHTAHEAERQASRLPAFQAADPAHIDLFAAANVRLWDEIAQASTSDWTTKMAQAAEAWAVYRQAR
jgi:thiamine kinase-like enzyme